MTNIIEFRGLSLATLSSQELLIEETRMKRVRGSQRVGESPSSSQQAKKTSLNRENIESVHSVRMCLFVEGDQNYGILLRLKVPTGHRLFPLVITSISPSP